LESDDIMLEIKDLQVEVDGKKIIDGLSLKVAAGEVHAIMGPNGSGKSTLAYVLAGREGYEVTGGSVAFDGEDLLAMEPEERAVAGVFLAMQYPVEIPGVANMYFLRQAVNALRRARGQPEVSAAAFMKTLREKARLVGVREDLLKRDLNFGFSGGEKKRNEIMQMAVLEPRLAILDETDSGLDIDALRTVADGVNALRDPNRAIVVITHYQRLLNYIVPDRVHVLAHGRIQRTGTRELALELEEAGYGGVLGPEFAHERASAAGA
jgi:Fe-S cluster assembly ATP-binding protein